jgi:hypothetical protein
MDEICLNGRDARVARWMELFREAAMRFDRGLPTEGERPFDFDFRAPTEQEARALAAWFRAHTSYTVRVEHESGSGEFPRRRLDGWRVGGRTPPLDPSPRVFEQWLAFIVGAGLALRCELEACSGIDLAQELPAA